MDHVVEKDMYNLAPHKSVFDLDSPYQISGNLSMPKPVINTISNWMSMEEPPDLVKLERMALLPSA